MGISATKAIYQVCPGPILSQERLALSAQEHTQQSQKVLEEPTGQGCNAITECLSSTRG